jgi:anti-anti-sigma factor
MAAQRHFKRMVIDVQDELLLLHLGEMDIWDGADLALLREGLFKLIEQENCRSIAIDMQFVKYIPSGFFGMLFDWQEKRGVNFALTAPQPNVQRMLWFQRFFHLNSAGMYELQTEPVTAMLPAPVESQEFLATTTL